MGLGPPVCVPCKRIMKFTAASKTWACPACSRSADADDGVRHLFCLPLDLFNEVRHNDEQSFQPREEGGGPEERDVPGGV